MVDRDKQPIKASSTWVQWIVGIPVSLVVLVLFILFVQPWGEPRESITSTAPKDGNFYDPSAQQGTLNSSDTTLLEENSVSDEIPTHIAGARIVDVNLASWKPVAESSVSVDERPSHSVEVEGRILVEISSDLWSKAVDDGVQFSIPQREEVLVGKVTKVDTSISHTRILDGTLQDGSQEYTFVLNLGDTATYAYINTSMGSYELVGTRHYGWLMDSSNIAPDVDFSLPDHFVLEPDPQDRELEPEPSSSSDE